MSWRMVSMVLRLSAISVFITIRFCKRCFTSRSLVRSRFSCSLMLRFICALWFFSPLIDALPPVAFLPVAAVALPRFAAVFFWRCAAADAFFCTAVVLAFAFCVARFCA